MHGEGYEVPSVSMRMETVDSDQDFEEPPPSQVYVDFLSMLIARTSCRKKERIGRTEYLIETIRARTRKEDGRVACCAFGAGKLDLGGGCAGPAGGAGGVWRPGWGSGPAQPDGAVGRAGRVGGPGWGHGAGWARWLAGGGTGWAGVGRLEAMVGTFI